VAALQLQHLVLCEIRQHDDADATADLSRLLDVSARTAQRIGAGDRLLTLNELVELACLFGDGVLGTIPRTVADLFPDVYVPLLGTWRPGTREIPTFGQQAALEAIPSAALIEGLSHWLTHESDEGRIGLVNEWVFAHQLATGLAESDIPSGLISVSRHAPAATGWLSLDVLTRVPTRLSLGYLIDPLEDPVAALRDVLRTCYRLLSYEGQRVLLLCIGHRMAGQLRVHMPGLIAGPVDGAVTIPFQLAGQLGALAAGEHEAPNLAITVNATASSRHGLRILAASVGKAS
jgi:hypothetical protein